MGMQQRRISVPESVPADSANLGPLRCGLEVIGQDAILPSWLSVFSGKNESRIGPVTSLGPMRQKRYRQF